MKRPFRPEDGDRRFKLSGRPNREWGLLEYPLTDRDALSVEEAQTMGILWWTYNPQMPHAWRCVTPEQVEPVRWWSRWWRTRLA